MIIFCILASEITHVNGNFWDNLEYAFHYAMDHQEDLNPGLPIDHALDVMTQEIERQNQAK